MTRSLWLFAVAIVLVTLVSVQALFLRVGADIATSFVIFGLGYVAHMLQHKN